MIVLGPYSKFFSILGWVQFLVLVLLASYLSLTPAPGDFFVSIWDKFLHLACWGVLLISLRFAWHRTGFGLLPVIGLFLYSLLIEILQVLTGRDFQFADLLANALGILLAYIVILIFWRFIVLFIDKFISSR